MKKIPIALVLLLLSSFCADAQAQQLSLTNKVLTTNSSTTDPKAEAKLLVQNVGTGSIAGRQWVRENDEQLYQLLSANQNGMFAIIFDPAHKDFEKIKKAPINSKVELQFSEESRDGRTNTLPTSHLIVTITPPARGDPNR